MGRAVKNKGLYMVLSVVIAIFVWSYVGNVLNRDESGPIRNIPVTFVGAAALEERGLMITSGTDQTVSIQATGKRNAFRALSPETVVITVDVSNIKQPGEHTLAPVISYNLPPNISDSSIVVTERYPSNVTFTVSRVEKREIPVRGTVTGSLAEGYQAGTFQFSPAVIEVTGEESVVNQIKYAQVVLDEEEIEETYVGELPYTFITFLDEPLSAEDAKGLVTDVSLVETTLPVERLKEVELTVNLIYGGGVAEENVKCTITPLSIVVSGDEDALESLKAISLGDIDLSKIMGDTTLAFPIPLAAELTNVSGLTEATVELELTGLATATVETTDIEVINPPEGYIGEAVTQVCQVKIRGSEEAVAAVTSSQVRVVADLRDAVAAAGTQTIPAKVYVNSGNGVGTIGEYNIVVSISKEK